MHAVGFEPAVPAIEQPQTYALDRTATAIGFLLLASHKWLPQGYQDCMLVPFRVASVGRFVAMC